MLSHRGFFAGAGDLGFTVMMGRGFERGFPAGVTGARAGVFVVLIGSTFAIFTLLGLIETS